MRALRSLLVRSRAANPITPRGFAAAVTEARGDMQVPEHELLLTLHRELCAAVRGADQVFGLMYVAGPLSGAVRLEAARYRTALAHVRSTLESVEAALASGSRDELRELPTAVECARQVC